MADSSFQIPCPHCGQIHAVSAQFCPITGKEIGPPLNPERERHSGKSVPGIPAQPIFRWFTFGFLSALLIIGGWYLFYLRERSLSNQVMPIDTIPITTAESFQTATPVDKSDEALSTNVPSPTPVQTLNNLKIYFLAGHGEFTFEKTGDASLTQLKASLEERNYTVESLSLLATNTIPEDAKVVVIPGPQVPLTSAEVELFRGYLDAGGALIILTEPPAVTQFGNNPDPLAEYLGETWGIMLKNDIIIDLTSQQAVLAIAGMYNDHAITQNLQSIATVFPTARSVTAQTGIEGISATEIILTSQQSWAETDINSISAGQVSPNEGIDLIGPVPIAVVAINFTTSAHLVIIGDADFVTNQGLNALGNTGNIDLILNIVNWIAQEIQNSQ